MAINFLLLALAIIFSIQFLFFLLAAFLKTDKFTDLAYGITFVILTWLFFFKGSIFSLSSFFLVLMVSAWGLRLAAYLLIRILRIKEDKRFDQIRKNLVKLAGFWSLQTVSIFLISLNFLLFLQKKEQVIFTPLMVAGFLLWLLGLGIETIADYQKFVFKNKKKNKDKWIDSGLWAYSRHPNYFGEILCWWGVYFYTLPVLAEQGALLSLISPLFITFLLLKVSGIPLLEKKYNQRYQNNQAYLKYKKKTSLFVPWFKKK